MPSPINSIQYQNSSGGQIQNYSRDQVEHGLPLNQTQRLRAGTTAEVWSSRVCAVSRLLGIAASSLGGFVLSGVGIAGVEGYGPFSFRDGNVAANSVIIAGGVLWGVLSPCLLVNLFSQTQGRGGRLNDQGSNAGQGRSTAFVTNPEVTVAPRHLSLRMPDQAVLSPDSNVDQRSRVVILVNPDKTIALARSLLRMPAEAVLHPDEMQGQSLQRLQGHLDDVR
jgi:hypothetical protein